MDDHEKPADYTAGMTVTVDDVNSKMNGFASQLWTNQTALYGLVVPKQDAFSERWDWFRDLAGALQRNPRPDISLSPREPDYSGAGAIRPSQVDKWRILREYRDTLRTIRVSVGSTISLYVCMSKRVAAGAGATATASPRSSSPPTAEKLKWPETYNIRTRTEFGDENNVYPQRHELIRHFAVDLYDDRRLAELVHSLDAVHGYNPTPRYAVERGTPNPGLCLNCRRTEWERNLRPTMEGLWLRMHQDQLQEEYADEEVDVVFPAPDSYEERVRNVLFPGSDYNAEHPWVRRRMASMPALVPVVTMLVWAYWDTDAPKLQEMITERKWDPPLHSRH